MFYRRRPLRLISRLVLWSAVCALFLKAMVPMLAAGAARLRGVAVAEVCTVYGVVLPPVAASAEGVPALHPDHEHGHAGHMGHTGADHAGYAEHAGYTEPASSDDDGDGDEDEPPASRHAGDTCALTGLATLAVADTPALAADPMPAAASGRHPWPAARVVPCDACARWAARLRHGPPIPAWIEHRRTA